LFVSVVQGFKAALRNTACWIDDADREQSELLNLLMFFKQERARAAPRTAVAQFFHTTSNSKREQFEALDILQ
jgi:hypothetical protein